MKTIVVINSKETKVVSFSGKRDDIYQFVGKCATRLEDMVFGKPGQKNQLHVLFNLSKIKEDTETNLNGIIINGNLVVTLMTPNMEFVNTSLKDVQPILDMVIKS